jgi:hypothetical protein
MTIRPITRNNKTHLLVDLAPRENKPALEAAVVVPPGFSDFTLTGGECLWDDKWEVDVAVDVERECPFGYRLEDWL